MRKGLAKSAKQDATLSALCETFAPFAGSALSALCETFAPFAGNHLCGKRPLRDLCALCGKPSLREAPFAIPLRPLRDLCALCGKPSLRETIFAGSALCPLLYAGGWATPPYSTVANKAPAPSSWKAHRARAL